ncbi:MAG: IS1634 family transposase [Eubacteriales bacterium]|nr:IS1634 family transposase [Eubacteriales bacterium]
MAYRLDVREQKKGTYLIIQEKYWDKNKKRPGTKHHETLGYLHDLQNEFPDPIAHFKEIVNQMNADEKSSNTLMLAVDMNEKLSEESHTRYNMGYVVIMKIYHELELDRFFHNKARHEAFEYNTNSIMKLLIITRILHPSSKKRSYEYKDMFFERFDFALYDVYRALSHFSKIGLECQRFISDQINVKFGRDTTLMYFDVTNFHFEIDKPDDLRKYGKEKNNRPDPIVQMGLAMDADGIPLYYKIFPGNTHDSKTFIPIFRDVCVKFNPGRVIAVADMGCTSSDNIYFLKGGDRDKRVNGYVFSFSIRKSTEQFKKYVLDDTGYTDSDGKALKNDYDYKVKSRLEVREIKITMKNGSKKSVLIDEKQIIYWSRKYADKARTERAETIKKALDIISNPQKHNKGTAHGAAAYIQNISYDKKTGEIHAAPGKMMVFNEEKAAEDAKYDGYYCIITSELDMADQHVIEIYRGLSDIEDNFKVSKSNLDIQPVHVSRVDRINAHVLTCFISLVILRLIQKKTAFSFTPEQIVTCLQNISCSLEHTNLYLFDYRSNISDEIGNVFGIDFTNKRLRLSEIKNILASSKK